MLNFSSLKFFFLDKVGIDGAIFYTVLARLIQAGGGLITIIFVAKFLTVVEQGYYFTFSSLLAIQIFFEMGLSSVIIQYVAHEIADLKWKNSFELLGSEESKSRLSHLLRFCLKWFASVAILLLLLLLGAGFYFFNQYQYNAIIDWQTPWIILSIATVCNFLFSPLLAFLEGLGMVKDIAKFRLVHQTLQIILMLVFLVLDFKLLATPIAAIICSFLPIIWICTSITKRNIIKYVWKQIGIWKVNYRTEIFPYQWRIAISWVSGYFMYQLFNPVLFATEGPVIAGQMGMTLAALNGILAISLSWINTKIPLFANLIARKEYNNLDEIFNKSLIQSSVICVICLILLISTLQVSKIYNYNFSSRFLPFIPLLLLCLTTLINQFISGLATYLRCHKQEPFLFFSIIMAVLTGLSTVIFGNKFGLNGIVYGYSFLTIVVSLIWSCYIFKEKKKEWR